MYIWVHRNPTSSFQTKQISHKMGSSTAREKQIKKKSANENEHNNTIWYQRKKAKDCNAQRQQNDAHPPANITRMHASALSPHILQMTTQRYRVAGLLLVSAVIFSVQLLQFSPFWSYHRLIQQKRDSEQATGDIASSRDKMLLDLSRANSAMEGMLDDGHLSEEINKIGVAEDSQDDEIFAPIIIGAGQGTTGTHLFAEATCRLGFVSLHYGIGCFPENVFTLKEPKLRFTDVVNSSTHESSNLNDKTRPPSCPISISPTHKHYQSLLKHHTRLSKGYVVSMMGKNETNPNDTKNDIINSLEEIIAWGKRHKVVLALHDTPYPLLMPEILKLVQKYYGGGKTHGNLTSIEADLLEGSFGNKTIHIENDQGSHASILHNSTVQNEYITVKPIILLSERKSADYVSRRIKGHGSYSYICQPTEQQLRGITSNNMQNSIPNATSVMPPSSIAIEKMNPITLEGGAFDLKGCFNTFTSIHSELNLTHSHSLRIDQIFYSFKKANRLGHKQFIIDTMQNYQVTVRELAMFSYDMFLQENKTSANDLSTWIKQSMIESLVKEDGHMRMNVGMDFLGFDSFFKANEFEVEVRRGHRRRHYGDSYVDSVFSLTADSRLVNGSDANSTPPSRAPKMLRFHLWSMQLMASLDGEKVCPDN